MARTVNEQARQEKRELILQAAVTAFPENGFSGTTFALLAKSLGISAATILLYFESKEELFRCAVLEPLERFRQPFLAFMQGEGTPLERIKSMIDVHIRIAASNSSFLRLVQYVLGQHQRFPEEAEAMYRFANDYTVGLTTVIAEGQAAGQLQSYDAHEVAWGYFCFIQGVGLVNTDDSSSPVWDGMRRVGLQLFAPVTNQ
ncbi:TetR/AcrR family transcriptional regulator [Paenibacillus sp. ATY16]|uniref:TetR/AcrR family transcriptional regulator n=1 Tax=Paenibacillus sp. ATY16 TaxID=1759312 RepID=UPI000E2EB108|nr:TetR/AcrR family transcriptional regulator [Paenibacillus sp. ATY16]MCK9858358.1 TetR/AcrR family transcriptional regulator [Paenibacillus sp. ATY16]